MGCPHDVMVADQAVRMPRNHRSLLWSLSAKESPVSSNRKQSDEASSPSLGLLRCTRLAISRMPLRKTDSTSWNLLSSIPHGVLLKDLKFPQNKNFQHGRGNSMSRNKK